MNIKTRVTIIHGQEIQVKVYPEGAHMSNKPVTSPTRGYKYNQYKDQYRSYDPTTDVDGNEWRSETNGM